MRHMETYTTYSTEPSSSTVSCTVPDDVDVDNVDGNISALIPGLLRLHKSLLECQNVLTELIGPGIGPLDETAVASYQGNWESAYKLVSVRNLMLLLESEVALLKNQLDRLDGGI